MVRNFTLKLFTLMLALAANLTAPAGFAADGLQLDLDEINRIIDQSDDVGPPQDEYGRSVTLEEAIRIALEHNLGLQIAALDVERQLNEISDTKSIFHPVAGLSFTAGGSESRDGVTFFPIFNDNLNGVASVSQAIPTGRERGRAAEQGRDEFGLVIHQPLHVDFLEEPANPLRVERLVIERQNDTADGGKPAILLKQ